MSANRKGRISGGNLMPFWFTEEAPTAVPRGTNAVTPATYKDRTFTSGTSTVITDFLWPIQEDASRAGVEAITLSSLSPGVITPPSAGSSLWTGVSAGTATIRASCASRTVDRVVTVTSQAAQPSTGNWGFATGSCAKHISDAVDALLAAGSPAQMQTYSDRDPWTRNPSLWAASVDFTGVPAGEDIKNGVLISEDILVCAAHAPCLGTLTFVKSDNTVVTRQTGDFRYVTGDLLLVKLSEAVPAGITPARVLPENYATKLPMPLLGGDSHVAYPWKVPLISCNRMRDVFVNDVMTRSSHMLQVIEPVDATRLSFWKTRVQYDSGSPSFLLINGLPVVTHCWTTVQNGTFIVHDAALQAAITALGGQPATSVDLSGFNSY